MVPAENVGVRLGVGVGDRVLVGSIITTEVDVGAVVGVAVGMPIVAVSGVGDGLGVGVWESSASAVAVARAAGLLPPPPPPRAQLLSTNPRTNKTVIIMSQ